MWKRIYFGILVVCTSISCSQESEKLVNKDDVKPYLNEQTWIEKSGIDGIEKDIEFWKEKLNTTNSPVFKLKLASAYQSKFGTIKDVTYLAKADQLLQESNEFYKEKNAGVLQALARLSITKHDFQSAIEYAEKALIIGENKLLSHMIIYDASMETGDYEHANYILENEITNKVSFNYFIRTSQYQDYLGNSSESIAALEKGIERIDYSVPLSAWGNSNLGDRLGHNNEVTRSYEKYTEVLKNKKPGDSFLHSLKGIAYIAYAHDGNLDLAKEILTFVSEHLQSPDSNLLFAEMAEYEGDLEIKREYLNKFYTEASDPKYYGMYDAELIKLAAAEFGDFEVADALVEKEIRNRPSPISYDLKAWVMYHKGDIEEAQSILKEKVLGKTYEPVPAYHAGIIFKKAGDNEKAKEFFNSAKEASFELGPVTVRDINSKL